MVTTSCLGRRNTAQNIETDSGDRHFMGMGYRCLPLPCGSLFWAEKMFIFSGEGNIRNTFLFIFLHVFAKGWVNISCRLALETMAIYLLSILKARDQGHRQGQHPLRPLSLACRWLSSPCDFNHLPSVSVS